jgi:hypothetical protein
MTAFRSFLEEQKKLTLCLHDRDFVPGLLIVDNIFESISQSRTSNIYLNNILYYLESLGDPVGRYIQCIIVGV